MTHFSRDSRCGIVARSGAWATLIGLLCALSALPVAAQNTVPLFSRNITQTAGLEGRLAWIDGYANFSTLSTRAGIADLMEKLRRAKINTVVFGAKMYGGHALYHSSIAPRLTEWKGQRIAPDHDILRVLLEEAHARGLKVHAAVDVFAEGHRIMRSGPIYEHPEWQTTLYRVRRELVLADNSRLPVYAVNTDVPGEVVAAFTPGYGWRKPRPENPDVPQAIAILAGPANDMRVLSVVDGALLADNALVKMPPDGLLLFGRGSMAEWMLRSLRVGEPARFAAVDQFVPIGADELEGSALFSNPVLPEVRARARQIFEEIVRNYPVDGITFDRMRFHGVNADFSDYTRAQFEKSLGRKVANWPDDILKIDPIPGRPFARGPLFNDWVAWRAGIITSFLRETVAAARAIRPQVRTGVYVGSWYDHYYAEGVNWASPEYQGSADWMTTAYGQAGYARDVDYITTGCYYPTNTVEEALAEDSPIERTVQEAAQRSQRVVSDAAFVYAGLYLLQYRNNPEAFKAAIRTSRQHSQGVMLFDVVYLNQYGLWNVLEDVFTTPAIAPHDVPDLLAGVRRVRETIRAVDTGTGN